MSLIQYSCKTCGYSFLGGGESHCKTCGQPLTKEPAPYGNPCTYYARGESGVCIYLKNCQDIISHLTCQETTKGDGTHRRLEPT